jgi:hypothetical protein
MSETLNGILLNLLYAFLIAAIPICGAGIKAVSAKVVEYYTTKSKSEQLNNILVDITNFGADAVTYVMQTYVDSLKKQGKFDEEAQKEAFNMAMESAKQFISDESQELFESVYGNLEDYLEMVIEAKVKELKMKQNTN